MVGYVRELWRDEEEKRDLPGCEGYPGLIDAAPDLLQACASVWLMLSATEDNELRLIAEECRAAIAKAELRR